MRKETPTIWKVWICFLLFHGCLHTSIPLDKVDNIPWGKASVSHVTVPGSKQAFLFPLSSSPWVCNQPLLFSLTFVLWLSPYPDTPLPKALISGNISHLEPAAENELFFCVRFLMTKFSRTFSSLVMAYIFILVNRSPVKLKCEGKANSAHSFLSSTGIFDSLKQFLTLF